MLSGAAMRPLPSRHHLGFALAALFVVGCQNEVSIDGTDCKDPKPEVPPGTWCPPSYQCVDGEWVDTAGACPEPTCPGAKPESGSACQAVGQVCTYEEDVPCGPLEQVSAVCTQNGWQVTTNYCSPEPICPDALPVVGTDCTGWTEAFGCMYPVQTPCGEQFAFIDCTITPEGSTWTLTGGPSCGMCDGYGAEADCGTDSSCQWLHPGCEGTPIETGCYPKQGCDVAPCADTFTCVETNYDPCYGQLCDACGAPYFTCVPQ
jgi:hypothetical protein